jgi:hypothetical protein
MRRLIFGASYLEVKKELVVRGNETNFAPYACSLSTPKDSSTIGPSRRHYSSDPARHQAAAAPHKALTAQHHHDARLIVSASL